MTYSPKKNNTPPIIIAGIFIIFSVLFFMFSAFVSKYLWVMQLCFVSFATIALQILIKYVLTTFEYSCDDKFIYIYKSLEKRKILEGKLELINSASYMLTENKFRENGEDYKIKSVYKYTRNFNTKNVYVYVTTMGETNYMIKIEVNDEFAEFVNGKIDEILKGNSENDEI